MGESARVSSLAASAKTPSYGSSYKAEGFEHLIILFTAEGGRMKMAIELTLLSHVPSKCYPRAVSFSI